ncbi:M20 metallopeptidase family protein [Paenibacillus kribbensis]|uniref:M20 metallopeptidase family protein n=1 Tax=Paenibacillus kribbensis TaxID=172713 RepID=UPI000A798847|nr:amidohydrolase [Paenibacillus kribbensis]
MMTHALDNLVMPDALETNLIAFRRELHRYPEVLFDVERTAAYIAELLQSWGLEVQTEVGKHFGRGVVGVLRGTQDGDTVLLRADMDALPVTEQNAIDYISTIHGAMHACGHDAHTAMLLGAAWVLSLNREQIQGTIKFVFQPAEEGALASPLDGRLISGGRDMIEDGVLEDVKSAFAMHVWPDLPVGTIGFHPHTAMAASSHFTIRFTGLSGHHSTPHLCSDAIIMVAQFITDLKIFMSTAIDPQEAAVLSFGTLQAGDAKNVIAGHSEITGTFRAFRTETVEQITRAIADRANSIASLHGGTAYISQRTGTVLQNDPAIVQAAARAAEKVFGSENTKTLGTPFLAGEDFALYTQQIPGVFGFIGISTPDRQPSYPLHHPRFDIDERALILGTRMHVVFALNELATSYNLHD